MERQITFRRLDSAGAIEPLVTLQREVWGADGGNSIVPLHQLLTAALHGGIVLGAYVDGGLAGFSYAFVGMESGHAMLCSHMLGVLPEYRRLHLGERLKWEQRRLALEQGFDLITWTYDPLEVANGSLNLLRLGVVSQTYSEDLYGTMADSLNIGLPTDRLTVYWHLRSGRVMARASGQVFDDGPRAAAAAALSEPQFRPNGLLAPGRAPVRPEPGREYRLTLPRDFQRLKQADPALALAWRQHTRHAFAQCFGAGFWLTGFAWHPDLPTAHYLFTDLL